MIKGMNWTAVNFPNVFVRCCISITFFELLYACGKVTFPRKPQDGHVIRTISPGKPVQEIIVLHVGQRTCFSKIFGTFVSLNLVKKFNDCYSKKKLKIQKKEKKG